MGMTMNSLSYWQAESEGNDFKPAARNPLESVLHWDRW